MSSSNPTQRRGRRRRVASVPQPEAVAPSTKAVDGRHRLLVEADIERMHHTVWRILSEIGLSDISPSARTLLLNAGARESHDSRILFPPTLIESALSQTPSQTLLWGRMAQHNMVLSGNHVYMGTGGAAPTVIDLETGAYRDSTLHDLFDAARLWMHFRISISFLVHWPRGISLVHASWTFTPH